MGRVMGRVVDASTDGVAGGGCVEGGGSPLRKYVSMKLMPVYSFLTSTCARCGRGLGREGRRGLFRVSGGGVWYRGGVWSAGPERVREEETLFAIEPVRATLAVVSRRRLGSV